MPLYSIKMRASKGDLHVSGAERIILQSDISNAVSALTERALHHASAVPTSSTSKWKRSHRKSCNTSTLCLSANVLPTQ